MWKRHTPIHSYIQHTLLSTSQLTIPPECVAPNQIIFMVFTSGPHVRLTQGVFFSFFFFRSFLFCVFCSFVIYSPWGYSVGHD